VPSHNNITLDISNNSPAVKALDYLSSENGVAKLSYAYKEMVWDSTANASDDFTEVTVNTSYTYAVGQYYKLTHVDFGPLQHKVFLCGQNRSASASWLAASHLDPEGNLLHVSNGDLLFTLWDGNGWGDNNQFEFANNQATQTDDNGNTVLYGTASFDTQYFIVEE
jgi:hypothetical protein